MDEKEMIGIINEYGVDCKKYGNEFLDCSICDCENCDIEQIEECYYKANNYCNDIFAESIGYGGYDSAEEFWDNLLG